MSIWNHLVSALQDTFGDTPDAAVFFRVVIRLLLAAVLGGVIGWQRQRAGKPAGTRTHMLVSLGAASFIVAGQRAGMDASSISRIIQGLAAGVGFVGGGTILK